MSHILLNQKIANAVGVEVAIPPHSTWDQI